MRLVIPTFFNCEDDSRLLIIVGTIDLEWSNNEAKDCNKNAKNANDAKTLMGSKVLKYKNVSLSSYPKTLKFYLRN